MYKIPNKVMEMVFVRLNKAEKAINSFVTGKATINILDYAETLVWDAEELLDVCSEESKKETLG